VGRAPYIKPKVFNLIQALPDDFHKTINPALLYAWHTKIWIEPPQRTAGHRE